MGDIKERCDEFDAVRNTITVGWMALNGSVLTDCALEVCSA